MSYMTMTTRLGCSSDEAMLWLSPCFGQGGARRQCKLIGVDLKKVVQVDFSKIKNHGRTTGDDCRGGYLLHTQAQGPGFTRNGVNTAETCLGRG